MRSSLVRAFAQRYKRPPSQATKVISIRPYPQQLETEVCSLDAKKYDYPPRSA